MLSEEDIIKKDEIKKESRNSDTQLPIFETSKSEALKYH